MKYIKLILIIAVIAGLIYGAFCLIGPNSVMTIISPKSPNLLNDLKKKVDNDWDNASTWNQTVYDKNISDANVYHNDLDKASVGNYTTLIDYINEKVCNKLVEFIDAEFSKSNCSQSIISQLKRDLDYFVQKNGTITASDSRISKAYKTISLYNNILIFGRKQFGLSPDFNINSGTWADFATYRDSQLRIRDNFKKDGNFSSLSHITEINTSLNSAENKLKDARNRFGQKLSNEIIFAFSSVPRTTSNLEQLFNVYKRFYEEEDYKDNNRLSAFRGEFRKQVENNHIK